MPFGRPSLKVPTASPSTFPLKGVLEPFKKKIPFISTKSSIFSYFNYNILLLISQFFIYYYKKLVVLFFKKKNNILLL